MSAIKEAFEMLTDMMINGCRTSKELAETSTTSPPTVKRRMKELKELGLVKSDLKGYQLTETGIGILLIMLKKEGIGINNDTDNNGEECVEKAKTEKPDVIVLDVRMPRKTGWDVCEELKSHQGTRSIPIVILSAYAQRNDVTKGMKVGAQRYITKPADPFEVVEAVRKVLKQ